MPLIFLLIVIFGAFAALVSFYATGITLWFAYAWPLLAVVYACLFYVESRQNALLMRSLKRAMAIFEAAAIYSKKDSQ